MRTFRTLCSGGELFGVGARAAGWTHVDGYEIDPAIGRVAQLNGFDVRAADVTRINYETLRPVDHLHASPSCKTAGGETADDLAVADAICRAIRAHQGRTFSLENVWAYRNYESFACILATLHDCGFGVHFAHVNSADLGVPQTRKRLILRAVRGVERVPGLRPTHGKRCGILLARWRGWYAAIADILHTLPPTEPAPWQLARLPAELRESMLVSNAKTEYGDGQRDADEPALAVTTQQVGRMRAYLVQSKNSSQQWGDGTRDEDEPAFSIVTDRKPSHAPKAYIVGGDNGRADTGEPTMRRADEPAMTIRGTRTPAHRAYTSGRWVRMTVQALGRFQTVPDSYIALTPEINGNGVPCLLAQAIMESL